MSKWINWNDEHCPNGHSWVFCSTSSLYPDFYYCAEEDKFWEPTVKPIDPSRVRIQYHEHRLDEMRKYAQREQAIKDLRYVSFEDIVEFVESHKASGNKKKGVDNG